MIILYLCNEWFVVLIAVIMDSFISKLKSTVSEVLPGNPLSSDYDIQERSVGSAGPNMVWNIHRATKKTTKEVVVTLAILLLVFSSINKY